MLISCICALKWRTADRACVIILHETRIAVATSGMYAIGKLMCMFILVIPTYYTVIIGFCAAYNTNIVAVSVCYHSKDTDLA